ncbi:Lysine--tRNA ligase [Rickettsiales bacterium Ac37b]|nr:Lysine--tRNA ligase [Rickettsiales bacterium Ac37b]
MNDEQIGVLANKAWPFLEAEKIWQKIGKKLPHKGYVLFETGYGPSGLPHIGTFGEVVRTAMVRHAFEELYNLPTRLIAFSDDMDGLRKIPDNLPNKEIIQEYLGKSLTSIPDPFGTHKSFGHHMNARLCSFLDQFGFDYELKSATECYKSGFFDQALFVILHHYEEIMEVMLPTLGEERQSTYSPFLPICSKTGVVLQVPLTAWDKEAGTITYEDIDGSKVTIAVTGGSCKLQWKVDWAMRWFAQEVDFEMHGKDLISSAELSSRICHIVGKQEPVLYKYELFLDETGQKISKSKGNGLTIEQWLRYAPEESLSLFMYNAPGKAKRLYFDIIPKTVDDYITYNNKYTTEDLTSPLWHIHKGVVPKYELYGLNFSLLLNLASVCNPEDKRVLWGFIAKYANNANPEDAPFLDKLVGYAIKYYEDFILPNKSFRVASKEEKERLKEIKGMLQTVTNEVTAEELQNNIYTIGKNSGIELKDFFKMLYEVLLGQSQGPRLGSFIKLYGIKSTIKLIETMIERN